MNELISRAFFFFGILRMYKDRRGMLQHLCNNQRRKAFDISLFLVVRVAGWPSLFVYPFYVLIPPLPFMDKPVCFLHNDTIWVCSGSSFPVEFCDFLMICQ